MMHFHEYSNVYCLSLFLSLFDFANDSVGTDRNAGHGTETLKRKELY